MALQQPRVLPDVARPHNLAQVFLLLVKLNVGVDARERLVLKLLPLAQAKRALRYRTKRANGVSGSAQALNRNRDATH